MKKLSIIALREQHVVEGAVLNLIKGGSMRALTCNIDTCKNNIGGCIYNYCDGNSATCITNSCQGNYPCDKNSGFNPCSFGDVCKTAGTR